MNDTAAFPQLVADTSAKAGDWVVFSLAGGRYALPMAAVEAVAPPPALARVPNAPAALLGAAGLGGDILPIIDLARLLDLERAAATYDGRGQILRLRDTGGSVGLWVDRVERLLHADAAADLGDACLLDPHPLLVAGLAPPSLAALPQAPLGEVGDLAIASAPLVAAESFVVVEVAGKAVQLRREAVVELLDAVPWTAVPRAPAGLLGIGWLRGDALPVFSLAALLGLAETAVGGFVAIELDDRRALFAVGRVVGLRFADGDGDPLDLAATLPAELRQITLGFSPVGAAGSPSAAAPVADAASEYLAFTVGGQDCALSVAVVDRVVAAQPAVGLPRIGNGGGERPPIDAAIELRGQIVPVAALRSRLAGAADVGAWSPSAYVILRDANGLGAIGVDRVRRLVRLHPADIMPAPADDRLPIAGVAVPGDGEMLRIIAPERLWSPA